MVGEQSRWSPSANLDVQSPNLGEQQHIHGRRVSHDNKLNTSSPDGLCYRYSLTWCYVWEVLAFVWSVSGESLAVLSSIASPVQSFNY